VKWSEKRRDEKARTVDALTADDEQPRTLKQKGPGREASLLRGPALVSIK